MGGSSSLAKEYLSENEGQFEIAQVFSVKIGKIASLFQIDIKHSQDIKYIVDVVQQEI